MGDLNAAMACSNGCDPLKKRGQNPFLIIVANCSISQRRALVIRAGVTGSLAPSSFNASR
jgi:hypothetical protein